MITAQERFRAVARDRIAPALREMGFRGSGQLYTLPSESCWAQLGLQKTTWSDRDHVEFTANLSVVRRDVWARAVDAEPWLADKPSPNVLALPGARFQERIGMVMGAGDQWWRLSSEGSDEEATCSAFLTAVEEHGLPALRREIESRRRLDAG